MSITQHKFRSRLITALAIVVILFAIVFSLFRMVVPYITDYSENIEAEFSSLLGMQVNIGMVDADIAWLVPRLKLHEVNISDAKGNRFFLHFEEIDLSLNWIESFRNLRPELGLVSLVGLELNIKRNKKGEIIVQGFEIESNEQYTDDFVIPDEFKIFLENSSMYLIDSTLHITDQLNNNQKLVITDVNIALVNNSPGHKLSIDMVLPTEYGEHVEFVLDIKGALTEPLLWEGQMFVGVDNLKLEKWFDDYWQHIEFTGKGGLDASLWIDWQDQSLTEINAELNAEKLALHYLDKDVRTWDLEAISGKAKWALNKQGWGLDIRELKISRNKKKWPVTSAISVQLDPLGNTVDIKSNFLRIEDLAHLAGLGARFVPLKDFNWNTMVAPYDPRGDLYDLDIHTPMHYMQQAKVNTRFVDLSYKSFASLPSVKGLDGALLYDGKGAVLKLNSENVSLDFNGLFRNELLLTSLNGEVGIYNNQSGWLVQSDDISVNTPHLETSTAFKIEMPVDKPVYMDLVSHFKNGLGAHKGLYLPTKIMSAELVNWVDDALVDLSVPEGGVVFHGHLDDFPFSQGEGVFETLFNVEKATLKYLPDWPALNNMKAEVRFFNQGMSIQQAEGTVLGARFENTTIDIQDLDQTHVSVVGDLNGPLFDVMQFVKQSPLKDVLGSYITSFDVKGETGLNLDLQIPVSKDEPVQVIGLLSFKDNSVYLPEQKYQFKDLNGQLKFTEKGVWAQKLSMSLDAQPMEMDISTIEKNKKSVTYVSAQGHLAVKSLLSPVEFIKPYMKGKTDWKVDMYVPESKNNVPSAIDIFVNSNLKGVASTIIGPFGKKATDQAPFKLHLGIFPDELKTYIKYSEDFKLSANLKDEKWIANIDASSLKGRAEFMRDFSLDKKAEINLEYINISDFEAEDDAPESNIQVSDIPPLNIYAKTLDWKNKTFTDVNIETHRVKSAMIINYIELHAPGINIKGDGSWSSNWLRDNTTELDLILDINDLGLGLNELNISESIKNTKGEISLNWSWNAEPYKFNWTILQGDADFELEDGSFTDIEAGAGRLLGVLNFETIFSLDFRNQVADGFSFDDIKASFTLSDGYAYTSDLAIESKVADIEIQGKIGMADKNYDLQVEVFPKVSNAFTAIGVATGGPILGIGVHFFQKLFGLDKAAGSRSTVTGTWDEPVITEVSKPETGE